MARPLRAGGVLLFVAALGVGLVGASVLDPRLAVATVLVAIGVALPLAYATGRRRA